MKGRSGRVVRNSEKGRFLHARNVGVGNDIPYIGSYERVREGSKTAQTLPCPSARIAWVSGLKLFYDCIGRGELGVGGGQNARNAAADA